MRGEARVTAQNYTEVLTRVYVLTGHGREAGGKRFLTSPFLDCVSSPYFEHGTYSDLIFS